MSAPIPLVSRHREIAGPRIDELHHGDRRGHVCILLDNESQHLEGVPIVWGVIFRFAEVYDVFRTEAGLGVGAEETGDKCQRLQQGMLEILRALVGALNHRDRAWIIRIDRLRHARVFSLSNFRVEKKPNLYPPINVYIHSLVRRQHLVGIRVITLRHVASTSKDVP